VPTVKAIQALVRARLHTGVLPREVLCEVCAGRGDGAPCSCCDQSVLPEHIQCDVEMTDETAGDVRVLAMHLSCFNIWVTEALSEVRQVDGRE
jgi:hypothetical protein